MQETQMQLGVPEVDGLPLVVGERPEDGIRDRRRTRVETVPGAFEARERLVEAGIFGGDRAAFDARDLHARGEAVVQVLALAGFEDQPDKPRRSEACRVSVVR